MYDEEYKKGIFNLVISNPQTKTSFKFENVTSYPVPFGITIGCDTKSTETSECIFVKNTSGSITFGRLYVETIKVWNIYNIKNYDRYFDIDLYNMFSYENVNTNDLTTLDKIMLSVVIN